MRFSFDKILGPHDKAFALRAQRAQVLAANLSNADTPHYKARDFDFRTALARATGTEQGLKTTHPAHLGGGGAGLPPVLQYRVPSQPSLDGNTVDSQSEFTEYLENTMQFQASYTFLNKRFVGLKKAFKGE